jgi:hypothetical protein
VPNSLLFNSLIISNLELKEDPRNKKTGSKVVNFFAFAFFGKAQAEGIENPS